MVTGPSLVSGAEIGSQRGGLDIPNAQVKAGATVYLEELQRQFPVEAKLPGKQVLKMFPVLPKDDLSLALAVERPEYTLLNPAQKAQAQKIAVAAFRKERE